MRELFLRYLRRDTRLSHDLGEGRHQDGVACTMHLTTILLKVTIVYRL